MQPERPDRRQVIPRPIDWRPGDPAPWARFARPDHGAIDLDRIRRAMATIVRGCGYRDNRVGESTEGATYSEAGSQSAVLLALFEEAGTPRLILTRRAANLRTHRGEVSFPGGRLNVGESPEGAAVREASEEIGLDSDSVELVGRLSDRFTTSSGTTVIPVVGLLSSRPNLVAAQSEVERIFDVALTDLISTGVFHEEHWRVPGRGRKRTDDVVPGTTVSTELAGSTIGDDWFPVWFFEMKDDTLWGTSARIVVELLYLVLSV